MNDIYKRLHEDKQDQLLNLIKKAMKLQEENKKLKAFVLEILEDYPDLKIWHGFEIQEAAERHELLVPNTVHSPCGEQCNCTEYFRKEEFERGIECYRFAEWLQCGEGKEDE